MKTNKLQVLMFCGFILFNLFISVVHPIQSIFFRNNVRSVQELQDSQQHSLTTNIYKVLYCNGKQCPHWKCHDDSAVIHGYCCGCSNSSQNNVPVLCVDDLQCPFKMNNLCDDYNFMITCCCSNQYN